jgi:hypothetical protein
MLFGFNFLFSAEKEESVDIEILDNNLTIIDKNIYANCCSEYEDEISIVDNTISIIQRDTSTQKCRCNCYIDLSHEIKFIQPGKYTVIIHREELQKYGYDQNRKLFIFKGDIEIDGSDEGFALSTLFEQSQCKTATTNDIELKPYVDEVEVFPNPAFSSVTIRFPVSEPQNINIKLFNFLGKEIRSIDLGYLTEGLHTYTINAENIPSGMYLGQLITQSGRSISFRIIWSK